VVFADAAEAFADGRQRRFPGEALEAGAGTLGADPAQGMEQPVGVMDSFGVVGDLGAQHPGRRRVVGRAGDLDDAPVGDRDVERAGVRAIVRAGAAHDSGEGRLGG
jgi:hypothetical protein